MLTIESFSKQFEFVCFEKTAKTTIDSFPPRKNRINDYSAIIEHALRKSILDIELSSKPTCKLECLYP